jgi:hypothetical protein
MPFVLDGEEGRVVIEAHGGAHEVTFRVNQIQQAPVVRRMTSGSKVKNGTRITVCWPQSACSYLTDIKPRFLQMAEAYTWLNPHLSLRG